MSNTFNAFIQAIMKKNWDAAFRNLNGLNMHEMLGALACLAQDTRDDLLNKRSAFAAMYNMPRIEYALEVVNTHKLPSNAPGDLPQTGQVTDARKFLADWPKHYLIDADPSGQLPGPNPSAPRLSAADFETAGKDLGVEPAAIHAVADVESGGAGFDGFGRPKILFEAHIFQKKTGGKYHQSHPHLSQKTQKLGSHYYGWDQWTRMYEAMILDTDAAWQSASWGKFQVMGFNHNGWPTLKPFVDAMFVSEYQHLKAFLAYSKDNGLVKHLKSHDWASFAAGYNGADYATNQYDVKMAAAYARYAGKHSRKHGHHAH